ncbi:3-oxoacyl-ACP reductase [Candidatus Acidianus copahuensis]|uniref:3-oxoacyl-ACP reductase n=2 Tax=Candidatus Acidianus copahuensis TaxID=1160895 RepID=A0A031LQD7_9CREN|nr:3-oxoacyl-ACP reductase [Candidatus Acidianus copahuensis]
MMNINFSGKKVLISGGTHGIGLELSKAFKSLNANVITLGRDESAGRNLEKYDITFKRVDLSKREEVLDFVNWYEKEIGDIHVLINNASRNSRYSILDTSLEEWNYMINLELTSPFLLSQMASKLMIEKGIKGKIINISAIQAHFPLESSFPYVTVKSGLLGMTRSMAVDLGKYGIQVIAVTPGPIYSKSEEPPESLDKRSATLLGRMGRMREIVNVILFLSSDLNTFITGSEVIVDGGRLISRRPDPVEISSGEV